MRNPRITIGLALASIPSLGWIGALGAADPDSYTQVLVSDRVDGIHQNLAADLAPVEMGPLTVVLTSPTHSLEVLEHELSLGLTASGADAASLRARFQGQAHLVAELEIGGMTSEIDDHISLPLQETEIAGVLEITRDTEGYRVLVLEGPDHVEFQIESDLAGQLGMLCRGFAVLALGSVDCEAVDQAMSVVKVPLPEPGEEYFIAADDLTIGEREQIDRYLRDRGY